MLYQLKEDYKRDLYRSYTAEMLSACARGVGAEITKSYGELVAEVDAPAQKNRETTLEEAQAAFEKAMADSKKSAEQNGGEET